MWDLGYLFQNNATTVKTILAVVITIAGGITHVHFYTKYQEKGKKRIHEIIAYIGVCISILCVYGLIFAPFVLAHNESIIVAEAVEKYTKTLDDKINQNIITIEDIETDSETNKTIATVSFVDDDGAILPKKMTVEPDLNDGDEPYISYKELDKTYQEIMNGQKIIDDYPQYDADTKQDFVIHLSKKHYSQHAK